MKIFLPPAVVFLTLISCGKDHKDSGDKIIPEAGKSEQVQMPHFVIDSVEIKDSIPLNKLLSTAYASKVLVFSGITDKVLLDSIYIHAGIQLKDYTQETILKELERKKKRFFAENKKMAREFTPDFEQTWDQSDNMRVFKRQGDLLTLTYESEGYAGGAHGYYNIFHKTFDLKNNRTVELTDIFKDSRKINWNKLLSKHFVDPEQKEMLLLDTIPVNNNFYFDKSGMTFVYNQYEITAYAAGVVEINIPFAELKTHLKPEFVQRYGIK